MNFPSVICGSETEHTPESRIIQAHSDIQTMLPIAPSHQGMHRLVVCEKIFHMSNWQETTPWRGTGCKCCFWEVRYERVTRAHFHTMSTVKLLKRAECKTSVKDWGEKEPASLAISHFNSFARWQSQSDNYVNNYWLDFHEMLKQLCMAPRQFPQCYCQAKIKFYCLMSLRSGRNPPLPLDWNRLQKIPLCV